MKIKEKRKGILVWNEEEERSSILYINDNGFLEIFKPLKNQINNKLI